MAISRLNMCRVSTVKYTEEVFRYIFRCLLVRRLKVVAKWCLNYIFFIW